MRLFQWLGFGRTFRRPTGRNGMRPRRLQVEALEDRSAVSTLYGLLPGNTLIRFDSATPGTLQSSVAITGLQSGTESAIGIEFRPRTGQLFLTTVPTGVVGSALVRTYTVNPLTGAATFVGSIPNTVPGAADVPTGYDFNPTVDRIRVVNAGNENFRINPNNGSLAGDDTNLTFTAPATGPVTAEAYDRNFDRANATTIPTTLYGIDTGSSMLVVQGGINGAAAGGPNAGAITSIGLLGVTVLANSDAGFDITAAAGTGRAFAALNVGGITGLYSINLATGQATLIGNIGNGASQVKGLTTVPDSTIVVGSFPGAAATVFSINGFTGQVNFGLSPYGGYTGGVRVAAGDITGDGVPDIITGAGPGAPGGHVRVFDGLTGAQIGGPLGSFLAFPGYTGGVNVGSGDINGDGFDDLIVGADAGAPGGHVQVFDGKTGSQLLSFFAFPGFTGGVNVGAADFNLDGKAELIVGAGAGATGGHVKVFDSTGNPFAFSGAAAGLASFFAYSGFGGSVSVAGGDVNGDGIPDIVTGAGAGGAGGHVKAFSGKDGSTLDSFLAYNSSFLGGVQVATADANLDGRFEIRTSPGTGMVGNVQAFDGLTQMQLSLTFPSFGGFVGGTFLGGARAF